MIDEAEVREILERVAFDAKGLIPAIIQEEGTKDVLMLGYMDGEALRRTLTSGRVTFWSRSRGEYWRKGDTSGHRQYVRGAALALAGPLFRIILAILQLLLAFTILLTTIVSLTAPDQPSAAAVSTATGVAGSTSIAALIKSVAITPWGIAAIVLGVLAFLIGLWLLASSRFWPAPTRKYQAVRFAAPGGPRDAVVDWDALSDGTDPTQDPKPLK